MLSKKSRLLKKADFERVFREGRIFSYDPIVVRILANESQEFRLGISLGLKFSKKAIARNRIKRQIRGIFYKEVPNLKKGQDLVVMIAKNRKERVETQELAVAIKNVLKKANLFIK